MVKPPTKGMKNGLRYPHGLSSTHSPREYQRFLQYVEQRAREEGVEKFSQTEAQREIFKFALDHLLDAPDTASVATQKRDAA